MSDIPTTTLPAIVNPLFEVDGDSRYPVAPVPEFNPAAAEAREERAATAERWKNEAQNRMAFEEAAIALDGRLRKLSRRHYGVIDYTASASVDTI